MNSENCLLCGLQFAPLHLIRGIYARCPRCGLIWVIQGKRVLADYEGDYYFLDEEFDRLNIARSGQFIEFVQAQTEQVGALLDVGCGKGWFVQAAIDRGWLAHGIDVSLAATKHAQINLELHNIRCGTLEEAGYSRGLFDVITIWETVEHLEEPKSLLEAVVACMKPGGYLFLSTPNGGSLYASLLGGEWHGFTIPQYHIVYYSPGTVRRLLESAGLSDIRVMTIPPPQAPKMLVNNLLAVCFAKTRWARARDGKVWQAMKMLNGVLSRLSSWTKSNDTILCVARKPLVPLCPKR